MVTWVTSVVSTIHLTSTTDQVTFSFVLEWKAEERS